MLRDIITTALADFYSAQTFSHPVSFRAMKDMAFSEITMMVFSVSEITGTHPKLPDTVVEWNLVYTPDCLAPEEFECLALEIANVSQAAWMAVEAALIASGASGLRNFTLQQEYGEEVNARARQHSWEWNVGVTLKNAV